MKTTKAETFVIVLLTSALLIGMIELASADIQITNTSTTATITYSDLTIYSGEHRNGTAQVVLVANSNGDDITLGPGKSQNFNVDKDGKPLINWRSYDLSIKDAKGEHRVQPGSNKKVIAMFSPRTNINLYCAILPCSTTASLSEGQKISVSNGRDSSYARYFFSTTSVTHSDSCNISGQTGYSDTVTVVGFTKVVASVPRGCAVMNVAAGTTSISLSLTNITGKKAKDIRVTIGNDAGRNITVMNDPSHTSDKVDDNNSGTLGDTIGENDTTDATPATTCRLIYSSDSVLTDSTTSIDITFSGATVADARLTVCFSYKSNDSKHYDLSYIQPIDSTDKNVASGIPIGTHLVNIAAIDSTNATQPVIKLYYEPSGVNFNDSIVSITVEPPYQASVVTREGPTNRKIALASFDNGDTVLISVRLSGLVGDDNSKFAITAPGTFPTPFLGTWGILALLVLLAGTAWFVLSRRKVRTTGSAA